MPVESSTRPSRRVAARRKVVESSDEDEPVQNTEKDQEDSEEDFTPAPQRSPRKQTQPRLKIAANTLNISGKSKRQTSGENIECPSPSKKASPVRKNALARGSRSSNVQEVSPPLPTPQPSMSPEPSQPTAAPLTDITTVLNDQPRNEESKAFVTKPIMPLDTVLEKPMDIVLKSRFMAAPAVQDDGPKSRIVISYLILTDFKSYAGRQEVGPFHASFSSVVGPNGSGKSNVIDSLLFVFGFRASKMRQGKISALIHNSATFPDLDHCEVSVHFQEVMDLVSVSNSSNWLMTNIPP
jgi:structural maintenance of chromosome 4